MKARPAELQARASAALHRHLLEPGEETLHEAYEFGRAALDAGLGVVDIVTLLARAARPPAGVSRGPWKEQGTRTESFLLESLAPFEMAHRGVREANAALRRLDQRREQDARRLAYDLHDEAAQMLPALGFMIDQLRPRVSSDAAVTLDKARALVEELADRLRRLSHELRPIMLDDLGLDPAIRHLAEGIAERSGIEVRVLGSAGGRFGAEIEINIYRAAQEALQNIVRLAEAQRAVIELSRSDGELTCRIYDDGRGFPTPPNGTSGLPKGFGFEAMRERLASVHGRVVVSSRPSGGAEIAIQVPVEVRRARTIANRR